jgi:UDP-glucose 4-epimerase
MIDSTIEVEWGVIPYSPDKPMFMAASIFKLTESTNWKPKTDLNSGLTETIEWYRKNT